MRIRLPKSPGLEEFPVNSRVMGCARNRLGFILTGLLTNSLTSLQAIYHGQEPIDSMTPAGKPVTTTTPSSLRRGATRWWLAGLLVSCLLPGTLIQGETLRLVERLTQHYLIPSRAVRARSRRTIRRIAWCPHSSRRPPRDKPTPLQPHPVLRRSCADHDVLSRRGPPA
nr:hypothetical protein [uncultured Halomonas sp.]